MQNNYTLIIPNSISSAFRKATIPDFPSLLKDKPEEKVLDYGYSGCDFNVYLEILKEDLEVNRLSFKDIKDFDTKFQHAIGCWLISKQAKQSSRKIKGNIKELAEDILGWKQKIRSSDYKKIEINLKSLATIFYSVTFKKSEIKCEFKIIRELDYDEVGKDFRCVLNDRNISKSNFFNVGPNGNKILDELIKNDILVDIDSWRVRINSNIDLKVKEDAIRRIAKSDFDKTWLILGQATAIPTVIAMKSLNVNGALPLTTYTSKRLKDIYPKQPRYKFNMRQYLAGIKNNPKDIPQTRGEYLLDQFGYLSDCSLGIKKYRNQEAQKLINQYIKLAETYGLEVAVTKRIKDSKDIRNRYYHTMVKRTPQRQFIPEGEKERLVNQLTRLIQLEPGCTDLGVSRNKATGLIQQYGYYAIMSAYEAEPIVSVNDLELLLEAGCED